MGLGTDLVFLTLDAEPGYLRVPPALPYALAVAELVDLACAGRIALWDGRIEVLDRSPIGDALTDDSLARLATLQPRPTVEEWLRRLGRWRTAIYLTRLRDNHVLRFSPVEIEGPERIEIFDRQRAAEPVERLRALLAH